MPTPNDILKKYWGYDLFRTNQEEIIQSVLQKNDTLALLPTGGGKSICYQVPALCQEGICIVVSPLIALMEDQVDSLKKKGIKAIAITSGMHYKDIDRELDNCIFGQTKFLYISPERLHTDIFKARFPQMNVNLIAVDESHCISQWGHDFRPSYLKINELRIVKPHIPILAVTATATKQVREEIIENLEFKKHNEFESSFVRENLSYVNLKCENKEMKLIELCQKIKGSGVVYCSTRNETIQIAKLIRSNGMLVDSYHGGMNPAERSQKMQSWMMNETRIIVATNAFGMGVDKANVRFVIHFDIPNNPEAYFQEAGRGGRDGQKARAIILYQNQDLINLQKRVRSQFPDLDVVKNVYKAACSYLRIAFGSGKDQAYPIDIQQFANHYNFKVGEVYHSLKVLELNESLTLSDNWNKKTRLQLIMENEHLYSFIIKNKVYEPLLLMLTRSFPGIFNEYKTLNEFELSKYLKIPVKEIITQLKRLHQMEVVDVEFGTNLPILRLTENRVKDDYLEIKSKVYFQRKASAEDKLKAILDYVKDNKCRARILVEYFGQSLEKDCGKCDYCLNLNNARITYTVKSCETLIDLITKNNPIVIHDLMKLTNPLKTKETVAKLEWLTENGIIWLKDEWVSLK